MKNIYIYYFTIVLPLVTIVLLSRADMIDAKWFVALLLIYIFPFRTYIDGRRLAQKKIINKKDIWKMIIPGKICKYFKELYQK